MEINDGFSQTEVGRIPDDWSVCKLNDLIDSKRSIRYGIVQPGKYDPTGRFMVRGQDYSFGWADPETLFRVTDEVEDRYKNARLKNGDLILTIVGAGTGHLEIVPPWLDGANITQTTARISIDNQKIEPQFCKYFFQSKAGKNHITLYIKGAAQPGLNIADVRRFIVPLPSKKEQAAIVTILSDTDALINSLEKLIAKKRNIKQGVMQELFKPKEGWEVKKLGSMLDKIVGGGTPSRSNKDYWGDEIPWATVKDFSTFSPNQTQECITRKGLANSASNLIPKNTLIISTRIGLGKAMVYNVDVSINQDLKALFPSRTLDKKFLFYWFQKNAEMIEKLGSGSTVLGISLNELKNLKLYLPTIVEQKEIATMLEDIDYEISLLEFKLSKYRQIKIGMMQNLLTGKIRLI